MSLPLEMLETRIVLINDGEENAAIAGAACRCDQETSGRCPSAISGLPDTGTSRAHRGLERQEQHPPPTLKSIIPNCPQRCSRISPAMYNPTERLTLLLAAPEVIAIQTGMLLVALSSCHTGVTDATCERSTRITHSKRA